MPTAKLQEHLRIVAERLDVVTAALLSDPAGARTDLMAERRVLLADVARTCKTLEQLSAKPLLRSSLNFSHELWLVNKSSEAR